MFHSNNVWTKLAKILETKKISHPNYHFYIKVEHQSKICIDNQLFIGSHQTKHLLENLFADKFGVLAKPGNSENVP